MFPTTPNRRPAVRSRSTRWRLAAWRAVDCVVAFATLDAYGLPAPHDAPDAFPCGEREPFRAPQRSRRPAPVRVQHCAAPSGRPRRRRAELHA